jgi:two-component system chemotaxis response regulator CheB
VTRPKWPDESAVENGRGHDIVVVGASAGGIDALTRITRALPADLNAAIFVTVHIPATAVSMLPKVLTRDSELTAVHPRDGAPILCGRMYVAPPDRHLLVGRGRVLLSAGPRENGHRPAIDPLFRSAARNYGSRVVAVVLSGMLGDGAAGLRLVRLNGGLTVVQDPADALFSALPTRAIDVAEPDHVVATAEIPSLLQRLISTPSNGHRHVEVTSTVEDDEALTAEERTGDMPPGSADAPGMPSGYSCPECHGVLWEVTDGDDFEFVCRTGHRISPESLVELRTSEVEGALYAARRSLEEHGSLLRRMAARLRDRGAHLMATETDDQADAAERQAAVLRRWFEGEAPGDTGASAG